MHGMGIALRREGAWFLLGSFFASNLLFTFPINATERTSASFMDSRNGISLGGARKTSTSFREDSAISALAITTATSSSFRHRAGLLAVYFYPGTITDLAATTGPWAGSSRITWTAPGADGNTGTATSYVVKWNNVSISSQAGFASATTYAQTWGPLAPTSAESQTMTGLVRNSNINIRIEAQDTDNNQGYLSVQASSTTPPTIVSVGVSPGTYDFGSQLHQASTVTTSAIVVTNDGNVQETYSLKATTNTAGTVWKLGSNVSTNVNEVNVRAAFHGSMPSQDQFDANDDLTNADKTANATETFTVAGASSGSFVPINTTRSLWFRLAMPLMSSTTDQQEINVTVTAAEEP